MIDSVHIDLKWGQSAEVFTGEAGGFRLVVCRLKSLGSAGTIPAETNCGEPSTEVFEKMARRRYQQPKPKRLGKWWYILLWQDEIVDGKLVRRRKRVQLGPASMLEAEALKIRDEHLRPMNQGLLPVASAMSFADFIERVYTPTTLPVMARSTQDRYRSVIKNYLKPTFGNLLLRDLTALAIQRYFSDMATSPLAYESKDKIRDVLSSILGSAVKFQFLVSNPVVGVRLPPSRKGKGTKPYIPPDRFAALLELIPEPYSTMAFVAIFTGLRVSELIGLRWRNVHEDSITIDERFCRGEWGPPKSEASNATIPVNKSVIERIHRLKTLTVPVKAGTGTRRYSVVKSDGPNDLVFQSLVKGGPMRDNNIMRRHIKPAAKTLGLGFVNWRCLRTSHATWLKLAGADVKDAQAQMRHSRASTTLDIYQQFVLESQRKVVDRLSSLIGSTIVN
ncbi:MAG: tyrosine-type recombinase/integrase [Terriglobia bacterium]